jgi:hypothetical protein
MYGAMSMYVCISHIWYTYDNSCLYILRRLCTLPCRCDSSWLYFRYRWCMVPCLSMYIYHIYGTHMIARVCIFYVGYARCPADVIARVDVSDLFRLSWYWEYNKTSNCDWARWKCAVWFQRDVTSSIGKLERTKIRHPQRCDLLLAVNLDFANPS